MSDICKRYVIQGSFVMKIILIPFLLFIYTITATSYASEKQTDATIVTENTATKNITSEETANRDKADKNKSENTDEKPTTGATRKKNVLSRFFSAVKGVFGKGGKQKSKEDIKDGKSATESSQKKNYDYFVDKDGDGICDGRRLNRPRRQRMGHRRGRGKN